MWNIWLRSILTTDQQRPLHAFDIRTIWVFRPLSSTRIDDVTHQCAANRLSYIYRQVWVELADRLAYFFQGSDAFCRYDNIGNTRKECFSDVLGSIRWHGLHILAWLIRLPVQQTGFAKGCAEPRSLLWCPCFLLDCGRKRYRSNPDPASNTSVPYPRGRLPQSVGLSTRPSDLRLYWNVRLCGGCG